MTDPPHSVLVCVIWGAPSWRDRGQLSALPSYPDYILNRPRVVFAADEGFGGRALGRWRRGSAFRIVELLPGTRTEIPTSRKRVDPDGGYPRGKFEN